MNSSQNDIYCDRRGDGPAAILLHGNPATHTLWRPIAEPLSRHRALYAVDLPGFGRSPAPDALAGYALERLADSVLAFADSNGLEQFDLVGHSFGGAVSATVAARAPERIRSLLLITPVTPEPPPLGRLASRTLIGSSAQKLWRLAPGALRRGVARNGTRVSYGPGYNPERAREIAGELDRGDAVTSMRALMTSLDYAGLSESYRRIEEEFRFPLMLIGAGIDRVIPFGQFLHLRARLPRAGCTIYPDSGHVPIWQKPAEVAELVLSFWERS